MRFRQLLVVSLAVTMTFCGLPSGQGATLELSSVPSRRLLQDSKPPNPAEPCLVGPGATPYMTATTKCPKDQYFVSFVEFDAPYVTSISGADGSPIAGEAKHKWVGRFVEKPQDEYLVILRASDGKIITPKGIKPDGSFYDISNTGRKVCQLFAQGSNPLRFGIFRGQATADGLNVTRDDFYNTRNPISIPNGGVPCEQYADPGGHGAKVGKLVYAYKPGGCRFGIDDCST